MIYCEMFVLCLNIELIDEAIEPGMLAMPVIHCDYLTSVKIMIWLFN